MYGEGDEPNAVPVDRRSTSDVTEKFTTDVGSEGSFCVASMSSTRATWLKCWVAKQTAASLTGMLRETQTVSGSLAGERMRFHAARCAGDQSTGEKVNEEAEATTAIE